MHMRDVLGTCGKPACSWVIQIFWLNRPEVRIGVWGRKGSDTRHGVSRKVIDVKDPA